MSQQFYIAIVLYESASTASDYQSLYEEEMVLVEASTEEEARAKGLEYAKHQESSYLNDSGETITQRFKCLVDVQQVLYDQFKDGTPLYARHFRNLDAYQAFEPLLSGKEL
ncbi:DUF4288 domain-containing protein [Romeria aff. gracilis LEGE 07310]|uniref:DUF4288 domain-containing protein n=1 Tax=Vasconcelosia minhoensis LEGE 07310 TaxID=915328 RepID=A0A8J7B070_9CYAN|nr:DUF4288 domain-containing protein [Romeria gracilis]MBE9079737.1 DUF4288 domain-containing protein [Romeria aff. gracilis LEGE 07310]